MPDHSTFSKNGHGRFGDGDLLRRLFQAVVQCCLGEGLVGGEGFTVAGVGDQPLRVYPEGLVRPISFRMCPG